MNQLNVTYNPVRELELSERKQQAIVEIASSDLSLSAVLAICEKYNIPRDNIIKTLVGSESLATLEDLVKFKLLYGQLKAIETLQMGLLEAINNPKVATECAKALIGFGLVVGSKTPIKLPKKLEDAISFGE